MNYFEIIKFAIIIILGGVVFYFKTYTNVLSKISALIAEAEEMYKTFTKAGDKKKMWCINQLNLIIPKPLKLILTDEILDILIQNVFDEIQKYVDVKKVEVADKINAKVDKIK